MFDSRISLGSLRPVQDYRKLNDITIRNRYPLPLVSDLIDRLKGAMFFTKLDIRWDYNNVRIRDGDEHKAAFVTHLGLFEPSGNVAPTGQVGEKSGCCPCK
jgi:hypothetical protein